MTKGHKITIFIILLLIIDQVVKVWIKMDFKLDEAIILFPDWCQIRFLENSGAAYGMQLGGEYGKLALSLFRIVASTFIGYYIWKLIKRGASTGMLIGFALIFAGAVGNIIDSAFYGLIFSESTPYSVATLFPDGGGYASFLHGKVVDMLYFPIINGFYPNWFPFVGGEHFTFFSPIFNIADSYISVGVIYLLLFQTKHLK